MVVYVNSHIDSFLRGEMNKEQLIEKIVNGAVKELLGNTEFIATCRDALAPLLDDEDGDGKIDPPKKLELALCAVLIYDAYEQHKSSFKLKLDKKSTQGVLVDVLIYLVLYDAQDITLQESILLARTIRVGIPAAWALAENMIKGVKQLFRSCRCTSLQPEHNQLQLKTDLANAVQKRKDDSIRRQNELNAAVQAAVQATLAAQFQLQRQATLE